MNLPSKLLAAAVLAISAAAFATPANAVPIAASSSLQNAAAPSIEAVQLFLPVRSAEITDPLIALLAISLLERKQQ